MSAWICTQYHVSLIGIYAAKHNLTDLSAAHLARQLYEENVESVAYRYSEELSKRFSFDPRAKRDPASIRPSAILAAVRCLDYQSCEHPGWETSAARAALAKIEAHTIKALGGDPSEDIYKNPKISGMLEQEPWGFDSPPAEIVAFA